MPGARLDSPGACPLNNYSGNAQRGDIMDFASLLVALQRASQIPVRYVHGSMDVPEDKLRNWAGGL